MPKVYLAIAILHPPEGWQSLYKFTFQEEDASFHSCLRPVSGDDVAIIGRASVGNLLVKILKIST